MRFKNDHDGNFNCVSSLNLGFYEIQTLNLLYLLCALAEFRPVEERVSTLPGEVAQAFPLKQEAFLLVGR